MVDIADLQPISAYLLVLEDLVPIQENNLLSTIQCVLKYNGMFIRITLESEFPSDSALGHFDHAANVLDFKMDS